MNKVRKLPANVKRLAVVHMIGQMQDMHLTVKTSDVAAWLHCCKATASKLLLQLYADGVIQGRAENWRGKMNVYYWGLTTGGRIAYEVGMYKSHYHTLVAAKEIVL